MEQQLIKKFEDVGGLVGNTPLLEIHLKYKGQPRVIYAKAEYYSLTGSVKDRVAYHILRRAYERGEIAPGDVIAEATSGNTGIAFSAVGRYLGHRVAIYMPNWMSEERKSLITSFGAEIRLVTKEEGGFLGSIRMTEELWEGGGVFLPRQFSNEDNIETHYLYTGGEISRQLAAIGKTADAVVAGVGTGGTVMGVGRRLREDNPDCKMYPLEPLNSPTLSTGYKVGNHRIQGISDEFIPSILTLSECDEIVSVSDLDSIVMARMLSDRLGIGVGISSGANFVGCLDAGDRIGGDKVITTVFADDNKKYLSTDYSGSWTEWDSPILTDVELLHYRVIGV